MARTLNEMLKREDPDLVARAQAKAEKMLLEIRLAELRAEVEKTQTQIAEAMGVTQPTVAGMEREGADLKLSSLKRYVEAAGCKLNIDVELPDGRHCGFSV